MNRRKALLALAATALLILSACTSKAAPPIQIDHVHGMGFTATGGQLQVAAHDGIKLYADGKWQVPDYPKNDYMGFAATDQGFYTSGHPAPGAKLPNPLGLAKSTDGGKSLTLLALQGKYDFHTLGAGYQNHAVYIFNESPSPQLPAGLQYTLDEGKSWKKAGAKGLSGGAIQIAVHPTLAATIAVGTEHGLFLSTNHGDTFTKLWERSPIAAVTFTPDGKRLVFGLQQLATYDLTSQQMQELKSPSVGEKDAIAYVAVDPAKPERIAMATYGNQIHLSADNGATWTQILKQGKAVK